MARVSTITIGVQMYQALEAFIGKTITGTFYPPQTAGSDGGDVAVRGADATTEDAVLTVSGATAGRYRREKQGLTSTSRTSTAVCQTRWRTLLAYRR